jgi:hypothetical protein
MVGWTRETLFQWIYIMQRSTSGSQI